MNDFQIGDHGYNTVIGVMEVVGFDRAHGLILARTPNSASRGEVHAVEPTRFRRLT